jgi:HEAT repeat protein
MHLPPDLVLRFLIWGTVILASLVSSLVLLGAGIQFRRDRQNRRRIARYQAWEQDLATYLFGGSKAARSFPKVAERDQPLFQKFLARYHPTLAGKEAEALRDLYLSQGLHQSLPDRLRQRQATVRAQATQEVGIFRLREYLDLVVPLLDDPVPYVTHLAAQSLTWSGDLRFAQPVLDWVLREERYQRERLLRVLEAFGPGLLPWLEEHLQPPEVAPDPWILFALLAGSHRHRQSEPRLLDLIRIPQVDVQASALKALAALADPLTYPSVLPLAKHEAWPIRAQAAKALGLISGPDAIPALIELTTDVVYEVRRNAAQGLADLGHAGTSALTWLAEDPTADPFARDIARERLEWADERGHQ